MVIGQLQAPTLLYDWIYFAFYKYRNPTAVYLATSLDFAAVSKTRSMLLISLALLINFVSGVVVLEHGARQGVPPQFQCDRNCYPWPTTCNELSYLKHEPSGCWRCCLNPTTTSCVPEVTPSRP